MPDPAYDPLDAMVARSADGLRQAVVLEQAILAGATRQAGVAATTAAARKALALKRRAEGGARTLVGPRRGPHASLTAATTVDATPANLGTLPRRTRGP